jgi:acetoacetyl-CoA synthetase
MPLFESQLGISEDSFMMDVSTTGAVGVVWTPPHDLIESCTLTRFMRVLEQRYALSLSSYEELHRWSIESPQPFWSEVVSFLGLVGEGACEPIYSEELGPTPLARRWFPRYSLNFAENLLGGPDDRTALVSWSEDLVKRRISMGELKASVGRIAQYLSTCGLHEGDRVFAYLPNIPEAVVCMLATAGLGATWSSCGTDYQVEGLFARVERVKPRVLVAAHSYLWRGAAVSLISTIEEVVRRVPSIEHVLIVDYLAADTAPLPVSRTNLSVSVYSSLAPASLPAWKRFPFSHPLYIMFSSGTTGRPKGIVHGAGGILLEHKKEMMLHADVRPGDRVFYQTSTSWMMWNWLVSGLACDATILMYDGDPMVHDGMILWQMAREERITHFGTSAAYLGEIEKRGMHPTRDFPLDDLRAIFSTGSTLFPSSFDYVMKNIKPLWLQSISGGTDILGCFGLGCPLRPVIRGEVQCKSLGYDVRVFDSSGNRVVGEQGELVCASPAPSMPMHFLDDPDGEAYRQAYFSDFPGVWRHGDFVEETPEGGLIFGGRSDATLKPGGVRVATADIYAALQRLPEIVGALAVGYTPANVGAEKIVLFVVLRGEMQLSADVEHKIRAELKRSNAFYVPALLLQAPELPRTTNNKLAELSVKKILKGEDPGNASALANPASLEYFSGTALKSVRAKLG